MPLSHCSHWIFDMDGTLTLPVHDFDEIKTQLGIETNVPILEAILEMPEDQAAVTKRKLHDIEMEIAFDAVAQPGALELLNILQAQGAQLGILTRNDEDIAHATLKACGLSDCFDAPFIIGREICAPKPAPDGVLHLLEMWGAKPQRSVMVGDFLYDIEAGRRAGVHTVHFDHTGTFAWPEMADHKVNKLADIAGLIA
ncbi:MAG: HAD family hydrolase [Pseudomonadales bacterium]